MRLNNAVSAINDLKAILLFYPVAFVIIRSNISGILDYQLNRSALKKRKKDETVKEWLLYSRFREEIPKAILVLYFVILAVHPAAMLVCYVVTVRRRLWESARERHISYFFSTRHGHPFSLCCFDRVKTNAFDTSAGSSAGAGRRRGKSNAKRR